jgi:hypothetical protein
MRRHLEQQGQGPKRINRVRQVTCVYRGDDLWHGLVEREVRHQLVRPRGLCVLQLRRLRLAAEIVRALSQVRESIRMSGVFTPRRKPGPITEAACWSHGRRKVFVLVDVAKAPLAIEAVRRIDAVFDVERNINGLVLSGRHAIRRIRVAPLVAALEQSIQLSVASCRVTPKWPRRWTTCSSAGMHLLSFSTMAAFA